MIDLDDLERSAPPRVKDPPTDLWLVYGELEHDDTHWICCRDGDVSWCEDKQYDSDVHYVRGDRYDDLHTALAELLLDARADERSKCADACDDVAEECNNWDEGGAHGKDAAMQCAARIRGA